MRKLRSDQFAENGVIASNEVSHELGVFGSDKRSNEERQFGIIVRGRRDAMVAALNSRDTLDQIPTVIRMLAEIKSLLSWGVLMIFAILIFLIYKFW